jgi:hypothetical protein
MWCARRSGIRQRATRKSHAKIVGDFIRYEYSTVGYRELDAADAEADVVRTVQRCQRQACGKSHAKIVGDLCRSPALDSAAMIMAPPGRSGS